MISLSIHLSLRGDAIKTITLHSFAAVLLDLKIKMTDFELSFKVFTFFFFVITINEIDQWENRKDIV